MHLNFSQIKIFEKKYTKNFYYEKIKIHPLESVKKSDMHQKGILKKKDSHDHPSNLFTNQNCTWIFRVSKWWSFFFIFVFWKKNFTQFFFESIFQSKLYLNFTRFKIAEIFLFRIFVEKKVRKIFLRICSWIAPKYYQVQNCEFFFFILYFWSNKVRIIFRRICSSIRFAPEFHQV